MGILYYKPETYISFLIKVPAPLMLQLPSRLCQLILVLKQWLVSSGAKTWDVTGRSRRTGEGLTCTEEGEKTTSSIVG